MTFKQIEIFLAVADHRSFSKGGETVCLAQSTASQHIRALEEELGVRLFDRSAARVLLTEAGRLFYDYAARIFRDCGIEVDTVKKLQEGRPNLLDYMANKQISFVFNTPSGKGARTDEGRIRAAAVMNGVSCVTTLPGCIAVVNALEALRKHPFPEVRALQDWIAQDAPLAVRSKK